MDNYTMVVCYQYWFIPKDWEGIMADCTPRSMMSRKLPSEPRDMPWGAYEGPIAVWKIKNVPRGGL